jgi:hypothetical protein
MSMFRRGFAIVSALLSLGQASMAAASTPAVSWVHVPGAVVRADCIHTIPSGAHIANNKVTGGDDITLDGQFVAHYPPCDEAPIFGGPGARVSPTTEEPVPGANPGGWVEGALFDANLSSGENLDYMTSIWQVPPNPASNGGLIFLFNGLEPSDKGAIIQPVLQWGTSAIGGGNYWAIAMWYVTGNHVTYHSSLVKVSEYDSLLGQVYATSLTGDNDIEWDGFVQDLTSGAYSGVSESSNGWQWTRAYTGILEAYNITSCSQFPSEHIPYQFSDTYLYNTPNNELTATGGDFSGNQLAYRSDFSPSYQGPNCGFSGGYSDSTWVFTF